MKTSDVASDLDKVMMAIVSPRIVGRYEPSPSEEIVDDKIICKLCGQARAIEKMNHKLDVHYWHAVACKCDKERIELEEKKARSEALRASESTAPLMRCVGARFRDVRFSDPFYESGKDDFIRAKKKLMAFVRCFDTCMDENTGWYLWSPNRGNGKTSLACCVRNALLDEGYSCIVTSVQDVNEFTRNDPESFAKVKDCQCLILDDIGIRPLTQWQSDTLHDLIDYRHLMNCTTCFTSNYPMEKLTDANIKVATIDRISGMANRVIRIDGGSLRSPKKEDEF